jgi:hypothetical protein
MLRSVAHKATANNDDSGSAGIAASGLSNRSA